MPPNSQQPSAPFQLVTDPAPGQGMALREEEVRRRSMSDVARWHGGHRARIQFRAGFGRDDVRQDFDNQEDRELDSLTHNFLNNGEDDGPRNSRYITIIPHDPIEGHRHVTSCLTVAISCSAHPLNELKKDSLLNLLNANTESLHETNASSTTSSNTNEVRVE